MRTIWLELPGFLGLIGNIIGNLLITKKLRIGWVVYLFAAVSWLVYGLIHKTQANIVSSILFFALYCRSWWKWRKVKDEVVSG